MSADSWAVIVAGVLLVLFIGDPDLHDGILQALNIVPWECPKGSEQQ